jgi:fido (protein-threonine AMPylation protein)
LAAGILTAEGFLDVDPQAPLGGPDDKKDILARRDGLRWVAAVYFPPTEQSFPAIRAKFEEDVAGVARHEAAAFAFFVNQPMTLGDRTALEALTECRVELYHLERLRNILDSPKGYGLRLEFLRREMNLEEQIAFFNELQSDLTRRLLEREVRDRRFEAKLDEILERTRFLPGPIPPSSLGLVRPDVVGEVEAPMSKLDIAALALIHRVTTDESAAIETTRGQLRSIEVWIGDRENPSFVPPPPADVPSQLADLLEKWRDSYPTLVAADREAVIEALARLHHGIVSIHPFLDANGRVARILLDQGAEELLGQRVGRALVSDPGAYFDSLRAADDGDLAALQNLIRAALE